ncbi:MAG TPA: cupin domain-containing protein [Ktedonobacteraceae bacterium]|nr:cupin domain-containing protein [Ktedonobacteraceae bacterium]
MEAFELAHLIDQQNQTGRDYLEFLRVPSLSAGLYMLPAGAVDTQEPHTEDEIYYVISGRASIRVDQESRPVETGSLIFVKANVEHRFHTITQDLRVLVLFAPAEYTAAQT